MALVTKAIKGTRDIMPWEVYKNQFIEQTVLDIAAKFGFREIRTPVFEHTELFQRGVGETTDVVQKEMYTFDDKGGRSISLRPEGTRSAPSSSTAFLTKRCRRSSATCSTATATRSRRRADGENSSSSASRPSARLHPPRMLR